MRLTKMGHACVRIEAAGRVLVIDPGGFTEPDAVDGAAGVLITHEHPDHFDADRLRRADAPLWTNAGVATAIAEQAPDLSERVTVVAAGDDVLAGGFAVSIHGSQHALIHEDIPRVANTAYLVEGTMFHPGDSWTAPPRPVETLLVPVNAPWMRIGEAVDFARAYAASRAVAIHDGMLNDNGLAVVGRVLEGLLGARGIQYTRVRPGSDV